MTPSDMTVLQEAFEEVSRLLGEERQAWLDRFASERPELIDELKVVLAADRRADASLSAIFDSSLKKVMEDQGNLPNGETVGAWRVVARVGEGGMGTVFLAERADGTYRQQAALKLAAARLVGPEANSRFRIERQILATLRHPNIARLIDGGMHEGALPYLVMEYVEGRRIDEYCDENDIGLEGRLALFGKVCDAVDYAHRNLVVHRDIKPSNILVDGQGEPFLLDFGIAKLLEGDEQDITHLETRPELRAMTPQYASPEQVRGEKVTVATDVYALGVLLYRLLAGRSPYGENLTTSREIENAILDVSPTRPSLSLGGTAPDKAANAQDIARQRGLTAAELRSRLKGDLDRIVLECLHKEPGRRYASVRDLARDIERYLRHEPVAARGDSVAYRARKFARRNVRPLVAAGIAATSLAGVIVFYTARLAEERDRAELAAGRAEGVASFMAQLFTAADPEAAPGETLTALEVLEEGVEQIDAIDDPAVRAGLLRVMATSFAGLGDLTRAQELATASLDLLRALPDAEPLDLARTLAVLGRAEHEQYFLEEAAAHKEEALELARGALGDDDEELALFVTDLAATRARAQQNEAALDLFVEAIAIKRRAGSYGDGQTSDILGDMAIAYDNLGNYPRAIAVGEEALAMSEAALGDLDPNTVRIAGNLGLVGLRMADYRLAARYSGEAVRRGEILWPASNPTTSFYRLAQGQAAIYLGEVEDGERIFDRARDAILATAGRESQNYVGYLLTRGSIMLSAGEHDQARSMAREGFEIGRSLLGEEAGLTVRHLMSLAILDRHDGKLEAAERRLRRVVALGEKTPQAVRDIANRELSRVADARGDFSLAAKLLAGDRAVIEEADGAGTAVLIGPLAAIASHHRARGEIGTAIPYARRALSIAEDELPVNSYLLAVSRIALGRMLLENGQANEGRSLLTSGLRTMRAQFGTDNFHVREAQRALIPS